MRSLWVKIHLYVAAFFMPMLFLMATSGGLYLVGIKGNVEQESIKLVAPATLKGDSDTLEQDIRNLLTANGIEHDFEYLKLSGNTVFTRPTSRLHYEFNLGEITSLSRNKPDLQKSLVELHKGHGPLLFKDFQKAMAVGVLIVLLSGLWLGLSSPALRMVTTLITISGLGAFLLFGLVL